MRQDRISTALMVLRWVLGLVIMGEAARFAFSSAAARSFSETGLPNIVHLALAWGEMAAAIIFLIPRATVFGGWCLLVILGFAIAVHLLHGWFNVGALLVYAAGTWAIMSGRSQGGQES